jgi:TRAP-type C4-dicarboxylate transport system permease small subunit
MQARSGANPAKESLGRLVVALDALLEGTSRLFHVAANLCLLLMLVGTSATIILRPLGLSFYWIWPWTMQVFVWMSFIGFYVVYRKGKDISVDFVMRKIGPGAMHASRIFVALVILAVIGVILVQMPTILESQVGVIDGVLTPWGTELERYSLSVPLAISCVLIFLNTLLDLAKTYLGWPEPHPLIIGDE